MYKRTNEQTNEDDDEVSVDCM